MAERHRRNCIDTIAFVGLGAWHVIVVFAILPPCKLRGYKEFIVGFSALALWLFASAALVVVFHGPRLADFVQSGVIVLGGVTILTGFADLLVLAEPLPDSSMIVECLRDTGRFILAMLTTVGFFLFVVLACCCPTMQTWT